MPDRDFLLPDLGEGLESATIIEWRVAVGDDVELNQTVCSVETEKAEVDLPTPFAGRIVALGAAEGATVAVGSLLVRVATPVVDLTDAGRSGGSEPPPAGTGSTATEPTAAPPGAAPARQAVLVGYGTDAGHDLSRRAPRSGTGRTPAAARAGGTRPRAKPPVRKLARDLGVDLAALAPGSGPEGIITRSEVEAAARPAPATSTADVEVIPVTGVRARIAEHLTTSRRTIPDANCSVWVDCSRLLDLRARMNEAATASGEPAVVTPFALMARLIVQALRRHPILNSTFIDAADGATAEIRVHHRVHLGVGTATDRGLIVAVCRDAHERSTLDLATDLARLAAEARDGRLAPAEMVGSTFTLSNFGALGIDEGVPVINHPEAAILGIGAVKPRPVVVDDEVVPRPTASLTLAFDHRVCDGAQAGAFLGEVRTLIEQPDLALLRS